MADINSGAKTALTRATKGIISNKAIVALKQAHGRGFESVHQLQLKARLTNKVERALVLSFKS